MPGAMPGRQGQWFSRLNTLGEPEFLFAQVLPTGTGGAATPVPQAAPQNVSGDAQLAQQGDTANDPRPEDALWAADPSGRNDDATKVDAVADPFSQQAPAGWIQHTNQHTWNLGGPAAFNPHNFPPNA